jgi:acid stress chaperone HdeB
MPNSDWAGRPVLASIVNRSSFLIGELLLGKLGETVVVAYLGPAVLTPLPSGRQNRHNRGVALRKLRFLEESLMPRTCVCVALVAIFILTAYRSAQAQVTVDVTKVNCDQFVHHKISEPRLIAAWLSGYYNAKRNNRVIDLQALEENMSKVTNYCSDEKNFKVPVMKAVEQVLGKGN